MARASFSAATFLITGALLIWALDFAFTYVFVALACARGFETARFLGMELLPLVIAVATIASLLAVGLLIRRARQNARSEPAGSVTLFVSNVGIACAVFALFAIVVTGFVAALAFDRC